MQEERLTVYTVRAGCRPTECPSRKVWYRDAWQAQLGLWLSLRTPDRDLRGRRPRAYYLCRDCRCYHLTSQEPNQLQGNYSADERYV